jgi:hypothetical protein
MQCRGSKSGRIRIFDLVVSGIVNFSASGSGSETRSELLHNFIILKEPRKGIKVCYRVLTFTSVSIISTGNFLLVLVYGPIWSRKDYKVGSSH